MSTVDCNRLPLSGVLSFIDIDARRYFMGSSMVGGLKLWRKHAATCGAHSLQVACGLWWRSELSFWQLLHPIQTADFRP